MRRMIWVVAAAAASLVVMSASASAAGWNCSAAALSGQPLGTPVTANVGQTTCKAASGGANLPALPIPLQANVMSARTTLDGSASQPAQQTAGATGEVASLSVGVPAGSAPIPATTIPVPGMGNVDITQALASLLPPPPNPLLGVKLSSATASGSCVNGKPALTGSSHVLGLTVAGQELPVDQAVSQAVTAIGGGTLDPSQLTSQPLPAPLNQIPLATLQPLLDALPDMAIPPTVAQIRVTPGSQTVQNGTLTQKGLQIFLALGGQTVADLTLGEASVSQGDVGCAQPVAAAQLQCTTRKLALIDVLERKGYARLYGAADRSLIGKRVNVVASWNGKTVARPVVRKDGTFLAKGKLPPTGAAPLQPRALPGQDRQGALATAQALPAHAGDPALQPQGQGHDQGAHRPAAGDADPEDHDQAPRLVHEERGRQVAAPRQPGPLLDHARRAAERAGRGLSARDEGAQEPQEPQAVPHLHAAARGGAEALESAWSSQAAGVPPVSDAVPVAFLEACGSS